MRHPSIDSDTNRLTLGQFTGRLFLVLIAVGGAIALWRLADVVLLLFGAVLLAVGLCAAAKAVSRKTGLPRSLSLVVVLLVGVALLSAASWVFGSTVVAQFDDVVEVVPKGYLLLLRWIEGQPYGHQALEQLRQQAGGSGSSLLGIAGWATTTAKGVAGSVARALGYVVVALFVALYLTAQPEQYRHLCLRLVPLPYRTTVERLFDVTGRALVRWLLGQAVVMVVIGVLSGAGLWLLGIEAAAALGLMGGLLCFVPFVGAILAALPAFLVALTQGPVYAGSVLLMYVGIHFVEGNFITPLVQAKASSLPPVLAILSTVAFGLLFGPAGVLIAAPLTLFLMAAVDVLYVQGTLGEPSEEEGAVRWVPSPHSFVSTTEGSKEARSPADPSSVHVTPWLTGMVREIPRFLFVLPAFGLASGALLWWSGRVDLASWSFAIGTAPVLLVLVVTSIIGLVRGNVGLDIVAALAMGGALVGGETLAGVVVALMFAGGQALESYAQGSAEREMSALLGRVARTAQVRRGDQIETVPIETVKPGDTLMIRSGEALPVDGVVKGTAAVLDEAALTGEAMPVRHEVGSAVPSGVTNAGTPFDLLASRSAADSTYAGVVNLVESARASKAPMSRLADRYAMAFLAVTVALAGGAWVVADDWHRALAVLVVATPCPLILAVPVAVVSGMSWCARRGVLVKSAKTLETLARIKTLLMDKTGTLTNGKPVLTAIVAAGSVSDDDLVRLAASLAQASTHPMSVATVEAARHKGLELTVPSRVVEAPGDGLTGLVGGQEVVLGQRDFVVRRSSEDTTDGPTSGAGSSSVSVGADHRFCGTLVFRDEVRTDAEATLRSFRDQGVTRIVLVTGDREEVAEAICRSLPIDLVLSDLSPTGKVDAVRAEAAGGPTLMVGDGINDAPALASADVGVALGARGAAAAAEAADVVVLVDRLDRIAEAIRIARRTRVIALQSVFVGLGLSGVGMVAAAAGYLPPIAGALTQEVIDVAVILNALRCLGEVNWLAMFAHTPAVTKKPAMPAPMTRVA